MRNANGKQRERERERNIAIFMCRNERLAVAGRSVSFSRFVFIVFAVVFDVVRLAYVRCTNDKGHWSANNHVDDDGDADNDDDDELGQNGVITHQKRWRRQRHQQHRARKTKPKKKSAEKTRAEKTVKCEKRNERNEL